MSGDVIAFFTNIVNVDVSAIKRAVTAFYDDLARIKADRERKEQKEREREE